MAGSFAIHFLGEVSTHPYLSSQAYKSSPYQIIFTHKNSELIPNLDCSAKLLPMDLKHGWHFCHPCFRQTQYSWLRLLSTLQKFPCVEVDILESTNCEGRVGDRWLL